MIFFFRNIPVFVNEKRADGAHAKWGGPTKDPPKDWTAASVCSELYRWTPGKYSVLRQDRKYCYEIYCTFFSGSALWSPVSCITNNSYSRRSSSRGPRFSSPKCRREATVSSTESSKSVYLPALSKCGAKISFEKEDEKVNGMNTTFRSLTSEKTNFSGRASSRYYP